MWELWRDDDVGESAGVVGVRDRHGKCLRDKLLPFYVRKPWLHEFGIRWRADWVARVLIHGSGIVVMQDKKVCLNRSSDGRGSRWA